MREIGGYLQLDKLTNKPYYKSMIELNTGRNALIYLIKAREIKKIYLPYLLCGSIAHMLEKNFINYEYYHINRNFLPVFEKVLKEKEYLYIVNYYGQISDYIIIKLKEDYKSIIVDNTQAFFQKPIFGVDTLYSCRKFFGVPDGAYLSTDIALNEELNRDCSKNRMVHILGRFEGTASDYYENFREIDESFKDLDLRAMSILTKNILGAIDYDNVIKARNNNFKHLADRLNATNMLDIKMIKSPFAYPYCVKNGNVVRKKLINNKIYIPILWPNVLTDNSKNSMEYEFASNILPLPCDQRYNIDTMDILVEEVKNV